MRTRAEIIAQTEARLAELEGELKRKAESDVLKTRFACTECRWGRSDGVAPRRSRRCAHPLVVKRPGGSFPYNVDEYDRDTRHEDRTMSQYSTVYAGLCGSERALWHAKPTIWQRLLGWLGLIDTDKVGEHRWSDEGPVETLKPKPSKNYWFAPGAASASTSYAVAYLDQARAIEDAGRFQREELQRADITTTHLKPSETITAHCK